MNKSSYIVALAASLAVLSMQSADAASSGISGTFIQLNRAETNKTVVDWQADLGQMKRIGIDTLIVQWCAEDDISYINVDIPFREKYDIVDRFLAAATNQGFSIYLGLNASPKYWDQLTARDRVLRDFLLSQVAKGEKLQKAILDKYTNCTDCVGYYIPEEIDDLNWRTPERADLMTSYLTLMTKRLRANDPDAKICVSAFFRGRTAPDLFAKNLLSLTTNSAIDHILIQDNVGVGDPPQQYMPIYFKALQNAWAGQSSDLWCVIEAFRQTSKDKEPFSAMPASPERVKQQIADAQRFFRKSVLFSFPDYVDPDKGEGAAALYKSLLGP